MAGAHQRILKRIHQVFDPRALETICGMDEEAFMVVGKRFALGERFFFYKDNESPILAVAHLDSVQKDRSCSVVEVKSGAKIVFSPVLDDRLGAWVILDLLPRLGIKTDILLTTGEETGNSTAELYEPKHRKYNWMFQFDRKETDVVMYQYDNHECKQMLKEVGFDVGWGSFSDICELGHLGCRGFNFGVGYQEYHSKRAYAWLDDTFNQVARFVRFYYKHRKQHLEYKHKERKYVSVYGGNYHEYHQLSDPYSPIHHQTHHPKGSLYGYEDGPTHSSLERNESIVRQVEAGLSARHRNRSPYEAAIAEDICVCSRDHPGKSPHRRYSHVIGASFKNAYYDGRCSWYQCTCKEFIWDNKAVDPLDAITKTDQKEFPLLTEGGQEVD